MIRLTHRKTLEFYDVPQIFVATDAVGVNYLCVLYAQDPEYTYLGVRISQIKLDAYLAGQVDLRMAYTHPEQEDSLYKVVVSNMEIAATERLQPKDLTEEMLPAPGFYHDTEDSIDDDTTDTLQLCIPQADRGFLAEMAHRMGWTTSSITQSIKKVAVL